MLAILFKISWIFTSVGSHLAMSLIGLHLRVLRMFELGLLQDVKFIFEQPQVSVQLSFVVFLDVVLHEVLVLCLDLFLLLRAAFRDL